MTQILTCTPRFLPSELSEEAARTAVRQNPANAPEVARFTLLSGLTLAPEHIAVLTSRYWGSKGVDLTVGFLDSPSPALKAKLLEHMNAWGKFANVKFRETSGQAQVRISREQGQGYWSYLGTDILHIAASEQTMNLDGFTMSTPESEFFRVVRHETGHTLGFPHEHLRRELVARIDAQKAIAYFMASQGWSRQMVVQQVLTPLDESSLRGTPHADQNSIMCYQLPGSITVDGQPITGGTDIDADDAAYAAKLYPLTTTPVDPPPTDDWLAQLLAILDELRRLISVLGARVPHA